jgi:mannosyltransferase OCH1-like enzyme
MIPKIIHQIWTQGCDRVPEKTRRYVDKWKDVAAKTNYQYMCWSDNSIKDLLKTYDESLIDIYDSFTLPQQRSDFGRYLLLYIKGGFYLDMDIEPGHESLDTLLDKNKIVTGSGGHSGVTQSFIGAVPSQPMFKDLIEHIRKSYRRKWYECIDVIYVERTTGGKVYAAMIERYRNDVYQIPSDLTPQCNSFDEDCSIGNEKYRNSITITHFDKTWNILLVFQHFITFYRFVMTITAFFLIYLCYSSCSSYGIDILCNLQQAIIGLLILTIFYQLVYYLVMENVCRASVVYFSLLLVCYVSLSKKCNVCKM